MNDVFDTLYSICPSVMAEGKGGGGDTYFLKCPFCGGGEDTPPLSINRLKPVFFCFSCKSKGHISQLLRKLGVSNAAINHAFPKTGRKKAEEKHAEDIIPEYADSKRAMQSGKLLRYVDPFRGLYVLNDDIYNRYRGYHLQGLLDDGFEQDTLDHFDVGYDAQRLKIVYPLRNTRGELVGISGRAPVGDDGPKYKIYEHELITIGAAPHGYSIETVKHALLWNWGPVKKALQHCKPEDSYIILTEGFKAAMWIWQQGWTNVVACVGSNFTPSHSEIIARLRPDDVYLFFDNDDAGKKATLDALYAFLERGIAARAVRYPETCEAFSYEEDEPPRQPDNMGDAEIEQALDQAMELREAKSWLES